ncbi:PAAR domain-containing protein [filamentous cyanobacterium LEGE 11480]|uniref:PAAR domain-containing protein n=1 Tax=Romeriopsis navalis LEGE 11480 TaxID=2777977 RepID=A0A928Z484_9CYAN|nr:PAAR domain-containing protein [Romeriopsis navalis]MBE9031489.1 PAAR domain-containing protein [Romeriopsis navalis LEGE 11480]
MSRAAARITDPVAHALPPGLTGGPGSPNVVIGGLPAWRGMPLAGAAGLLAAKKLSDTAITAAEAAVVASAGTPGLPAAKAAEETVKTAQAISMGNAVMAAAGGADIHNCAVPLPIPPHGPGVVVDGSATVLINGLPAGRQGDTIVEALGPPNKIVMGCPTVLVGG